MDPDRLDSVDRDTFDKILKYGHQVTYVGAGDNGEAPFSYTAGRTLKERPELLVTGALPPRVVQTILNAACARDDEAPLEAGQDVDGLIEGYPMRVIAADPRAAAMNMATRMFGAVTALQLLWPDKHGRFPGEPGYEYADGVQPLFPL